MKTTKLIKIIAIDIIVDSLFRFIEVKSDVLNY